MKEEKRQVEDLIPSKISKIEEEKKKLLRMSEISLILDTYDDIFSDFDPRPFSERAMSDDFLLEAKKASKDLPSGKIELKFLIPQKERDPSQENVIRKRLREHFIRHHQRLEQEVRKLKIKASINAISGILMIMLATFLSTITNKGLWVHLLIVILEPAGWFTAWTGLEHYGFAREERNEELIFYHKMMQAEIIFLPY
jgi:hypothetical protein